MKSCERKSDLILSIVFGDGEDSRPDAREMARRRRRLFQMARRTLYPSLDDTRTWGRT